MGCGFSSVGVSPDENDNAKNGQMNGHVTKETPRSKKTKNIVTDSNGNRQDVSSNNPGKVMFLYG